MDKKNWLTKTFAIVGTVLVTIPVIAPLVFSISRLISIGKFQIDYLMPAELGLAVLIGAGLLLWAALRSKIYLKWIAWSLGSAIILIIGSQAFAGITGLASGRTDAIGWQFWVVLGGIIGYDLAVIALSVGGILLCKHLFLKAME
ncbi:MAG: hypothetical protein C0410_04830 [Anaerolinea sp.]|nr:hypothetical protein [Anaerolinea sp.]